MPKNLDLRRVEAIRQDWESIITCRKMVQYMDRSLKPHNCIKQIQMNAEIKGEN